MDDQTAMAVRAADELAVARDALQRAGALFNVIQLLITSGHLEHDQFDALSLSAIGIELCGQYSERADDVEDSFRAMAGYPESEVSHV